MTPDTIPVFIFHGDRISDVTFTDWLPLEKTCASHELNLTDHADRLVYETPIGCFELSLRRTARPGDSVSVTFGEGSPLPRCQGRATAPVHTDAELSHS